MSLTLAEARTRAATVHAVSYDVDLDLTDTRSFTSRTTVRFTSNGTETFLELSDADRLEVSAPGPTSYDGRRLQLHDLPVGVPVEVRVRAELPYRSDGAGMHAFVDPVDGERYLGAYLGLDLAQRVYPCFDQPDLKAPFRVSVRADPAWTVLANARVESREPGRWRFAPTPPIPGALLAICAGPWHSATWEHAGLPFGWHARRSLGAELERDLPELRATTEACFDHFAGLFDEPYPFDSYDQVMVPELNWGAQELPGCVILRDELLPRGAVTERLRGTRAMIIAHEMAHMWFGDSMSLTWWEDTWLQESFADYMGYRVAEALGNPALVELEIARKPWGYDGDARRSTHPVAPRAEEVPDLDVAATCFDAISYAKGNACLRQLATWLGDTEFLAGVNVHLSRFRFGNATLADFVDSLDSVTDRDVRAWTQAWLRRTGFDTIGVTRRPDGVPVLHREGTRTHAVTVTAYDDRLRTVGTRRVELGEEPLALPEYAGAALCPNAGGETFAALRLDPDSWDRLGGGLSRVEDPMVRAVLWSTAYRRVRAGESSLHEHLELLVDQLPAEPLPVIIEPTLQRALRLISELAAPGQVADCRRLLARCAAAGLADATASTHPGGDQRALAFAETLAATDSEVRRMRRRLATGALSPGVPLLPSVRWRMLARLAELGAADAALIETERRRDGTAEGDLGALRALAARPLPGAKADAWRAIAEDPEVSNRSVTARAAGLWSPEQTELLADHVTAYVETAPRLAARGPAFEGVLGDIFPAIPLTAAQLGLFRAALDSGRVPVVLARAWEDALDDRMCGAT
ncbi:MAG: aminopeptidase N [Nocardioides sp.]|uniref:aminopeptidase N n=1 Tax=Nocardioides sp. TaxID=35761 RepID=UPI0039E4EBB2